MRREPMQLGILDELLNSKFANSPIQHPGFLNCEFWVYGLCSFLFGSGSGLANSTAQDVRRRPKEGRRRRATTTAGTW